MPEASPPHPSLLQFCTDRQREVMEAWIEGGTSQYAAEKCGLARQSTVVKYKTQVIKRARKAGWSEKDYVVRVPEEITIVEEHKLRQELAAVKRDLKDLAEENIEQRNIIDSLTAYTTKKLPPLQIPKKGKGKPKVAASAFLSDTHFDEVVRPEQIGGINSYNREIADQRLDCFIEKTLLVAKDLMSGFEIVHLDLPIGGDLISGNIHDELKRTNDAEIMDTVDYWSDRVAQTIITLSKEFPRIFVPCVVGNHGRNTLKPRHKGRIRDNFDWLICRNAMKTVKFSGVTNVEFDISESTDVIWETMGWKYLMTHGDQASGGGGWGGIFSPIMRLYEKKLKSYSGRGKSFDYMIIGHWHQLIDANVVLVNGSLKGYDEFAHNMNFRPEPPQQAFWLTDPEHGKIFSGPLLVGDV